MTDELFDSESTANDSPVKMTIADYARMSGEAESTIRTRITRGRLKSVREVVNGVERVLVVVENQTDQRRGIQHLTLKNDALLSEERIKNARLEERLKSFENALQAKDDLIDELRQRLIDKDETISSQRMANESLNHERLIVTQQLQKYREPEPIQPARPEGLFERVIEAIRRR